MLIGGRENLGLRGSCNLADSSNAFCNVITFDFADERSILSGNSKRFWWFIFKTKRKLFAYPDKYLSGTSSTGSSSSTSTHPSKHESGIFGGIFRCDCGIGIP